MTLYGIIREVYIMDEGGYWADSDSIEVYESENEREDRLSYLNCGRSPEEESHHRDYYYDRFDIEVGQKYEGNTPIKSLPRQPSPELEKIEQEMKLKAMTTFFDL